MRKGMFCFFLIGCLACPFNSFAANAVEALNALKKFDSKCEVGISYNDYSNSLSDANFEVKEYLNGKESKQHIELTQLLGGALRDYLNAGKVWQLEMDNRRSGGRADNFVNNDSDIWNVFISAYPQASQFMEPYTFTITGETFQSKRAYLPKLLSFMWGEAASKIKKVDILLASESSRAPEPKPAIGPLAENPNYAPIKEMEHGSIYRTPHGMMICRSVESLNNMISAMKSGDKQKGNELINNSECVTIIVESWILNY